MPDEDKLENLMTSLAHTLYKESATGRGTDKLSVLRSCDQPIPGPLPVPPPGEGKGPGNEVVSKTPNRNLPRET